MQTSFSKMTFVNSQLAYKIGANLTSMASLIVSDYLYFLEFKKKSR